MRSLVLASALLLTALPHAARAEPAPAPTVTVEQTVAGQKVPKGVSTAGGSWTVNRPGVNASLGVGATNAPGMRTVVTATWTSAVVKAYSDIPTFELDFSWSHNGATTSTYSADVSYGFRHRVAGKPWSAWSDQSFPHPAGVPLDSHHVWQKLQFAEADKRKGQLRQVQWRMRTEVLSAGDVNQLWMFLANV